MKSGMKQSGMKKSGMKRPGMQAEAKPDRGTRTTRVQIGIAGSTPKKQLILPALDSQCGPCEHFVAFNPPTARVPGPHEWDQARVRALLGTGEVAQHMKEYTGFAELLFVACAQCSGAPPDLLGRQPINAKRSRREPPPVKMLVALATTGRFWLLRGGLHVAPTTSTAPACCAKPQDQTRYSRSASAWERARESYHVDGKACLDRQPPHAAAPRPAPCRLNPPPFLRRDRLHLDLGLRRPPRLRPAVLHDCRAHRALLSDLARPNGGRTPALPPAEPACAVRRSTVRRRRLHDPR